MINYSSPVIWLTGMSASGKSTLANYLKEILESEGYSVSIIDGDSVRSCDNKKLGFGFGDVHINNMRISSLCNINRAKFDLVLVPVISPYEEIRKNVRKVLEPNFHLVYLKTDINSLKHRDPKGLYAAADRGEIKGLIGYSDTNPYDEPLNPELIVSTANNVSPQDSLNILLNYIKKTVFMDKTLF